MPIFDILTVKQLSKTKTNNMKKLLFLLVFGFLACLQPAFSQPPDIADLQPETAYCVNFCPSIQQAFPAAKCAKQPHKRRTEWNASERIRRTK